MTRAQHHRHRALTALGALLLGLCAVQPGVQAATPRPTARPTATPATQVKVRKQATGAVRVKQGGSAAPVDGNATDVDLVAGEIARAESACVGKPVLRAELQGCLGTRCQPERERARFLQLLDLRPGVQLRPGLLALGRARLEKTRFFEVRHVRCHASRDGASITVQVRGNSVIRRVRFVGNQALFTDELRNKVQLQPGDVLNPGTPEAKRLVEQQRRSLQSAYSREGFDDVTVSLQVVDIGVGQVELRVTLEEGDRKRVTDRQLNIADRHVPTERERAAGLSCRPVSERELLRVSGLNDVDVFTRRAGVRGRSRIRERLRRLGYGNPKVSVSLNEATQQVLVQVQLGQCNVVRVFEREVAVGRGAGTAWRESDDDDVLSALPFAQSGVFDLDEADRGRRALNALLENRGYLFSEVELDVREVPRAWNSRVQRAITYRVTTGYQAQIRGMRFPGAKHFKTAELAEVVTTKPYDFFGDGGFLQTAQLLGDLDRLTQHYRDAGFFEFGYKLMSDGNSETVTGLQRRKSRAADEERVEVTLGDKGFLLRRPVGEHFIYLDVPVVEGRRTKLVKLELGELPAASHVRVRKALALQPGQVLSHAMMAAGVGRVRDWYEEHGYFQSKVEVYCRVRGASSASLTARVQTPEDPCLQPVVPPGTTCTERAAPLDRCQESAKADTVIKTRACRPDEWCPCSRARILAEEVDLHVRVHEGPRVRFGEVFVAGNFVTSTELITDLLPRYDSVYSGKQLFTALRKVRNIGVFRSVSFVRIGADECPPRDHVALMVRVVENDHITFDIDAGFQTANVQRNDLDNLSTVGEPPKLLVDTLEHLVSAGARLNAGVGERIGATLPQLVLTGSVDARDSNFRGQGEELRGVLRIGVSSNLRDLVKQPFSLGLAAVSWTIPRLGPDIALRLVPFASRDFVTTTLDIDKIGAAAEISKRFVRSLSTSLGVEAASVRWRDQRSADLTPFGGQYKAILRATWDRTDSPINPTRGLSATSSVALINATIENNNAAITGSFVKVEGKLKWHATLRKTLTLALMLRGGFADVLGTSKQAVLPSNEAFRLGGQLGVRGVRDNGVLQYDRSGAPKAVTTTDESTCTGDNVPPGCATTSETVMDSGNVLLAGSIEGRFPLVRRFGLWGAFFWDWGGIGAGPADMQNPLAYRHGVGVGLRFLVSGQIPLRIDYGVAVDRRCAVALSSSGQCGALEDFGQLQAGLLYAF